MSTLRSKFKVRSVTNMQNRDQSIELEAVTNGSLQIIDTFNPA